MRLSNEGQTLALYRGPRYLSASASPRSRGRASPPAWRRVVPSALQSIHLVVHGQRLAFSLEGPLFRSLAVSLCFLSSLFLKFTSEDLRAHDAPHAYGSVGPHVPGAGSRSRRAHPRVRAARVSRGSGEEHATPGAGAMDRSSGPVENPGTAWERVHGLHRSRACSCPLRTGGRSHTPWRPVVSVRPTPERDSYRY